MTKNEISYKEIYELIDSRFNRFESEFGSRIQKIEDRTNILEHWKSDIVARVAIGGFFVALSIQLGMAILIDNLKNKIKFL